MKKQIVIISIAILLLTVLISGCNEETNNKAEKTFIGSWKVQVGPTDNDIETWVFQEDNTVTHYFGNFSANFTWEDNGAVLCFKPIDNPTENRCGTYTFSSDNRKFTWASPQGYELEYIRVK